MTLHLFYIESACKCTHEDLKLLMIFAKNRNHLIFYDQEIMQKVSFSNLLPVFFSGNHTGFYDNAWGISLKSKFICPVVSW